MFELGALVVIAGALLATATARWFGLSHGSSPTREFAEEGVPRFGFRELGETAVDDKFRHAVFAMSDSPVQWWGTYVDGDRYVGRVVSETFAVPQTALELPIIGYPSSPGNRLTLEILDDRGEPSERIVYNGPNPREAPSVWNLNTARWPGARGRIVLEDGLDGMSGWLGVGRPRAASLRGPAWLYHTPRNYIWFLLVAGSVLGLVFLPGITLRMALPSRFYISPAATPVLGVVLLGAAGMARWRLGDVVNARAAAGWLLLHSLLAAYLAWQSIKGKRIVDTEAAFPLAVYLAAIAAALAFGVLPLSVAQEFNQHSTAQARLVASPPDHLIPAWTAKYFYWGKNGRTDSTIYFSEPWSAASRGPLAPLMITAGFSLFGDHGKDPPVLTLDRWPASDDGVYIARIVGIVTNALVILGGAALAGVILKGANRTAALWLGAAPVVWINTDFLWPKLLASYFVTLALLAIVQRRNHLWCALASAGAYYSHPVGGLFLPLLAAYIMYRAGATKGRWQKRVVRSVFAGAQYTAAVVLLLAPWLLFKRWVGQPDVFLKYPWGDGRGFVAAANFRSWLECRFDNLWLTVTPFGFYLSSNMSSWIEGILSPPLRWAIGYAKTLPGGLGLLGYAVAVWAAVRRDSHWPRGFRRHFIYGALLFMLLFWGYSSDGLGRNCLEPLAIVCIVFAAASVDPAWQGWKYILVLTALEAASVRLIGVVCAPDFTLGAIDVTNGALLVFSLLPIPLLALFAPISREPTAGST